MSATITLTVANGSLRGRRFAFREPALLTIGRSFDCEVHIPSAPEYQDISRHHCLLEIEPPELRVSDFGSLNGTFVNGVNIGMRDRTMPVSFQPALDAPAYALKDGDEISVGHLVFRVAVASGTRDPDEEGTEPGNVPEMACLAG
jgi:pSer/pThr/pTyr-binding forkhead associated (FHA) protein